MTDVVPIHDAFMDAIVTEAGMQWEAGG